MIPLSAQAIDVLASLAPRLFRAAETAGLVFQPIGFSQSKAKVDAALNSAVFAAFTLHDLRRTAASGMASLGVQPHVVEAVLNHRSGVIHGVAAVYNRCRYEPEKRAALDLWGAHVAALHQTPQNAGFDALSKAA